ncbi:unnamed protein product, partial [Adineta ricciae]
NETNIASLVLGLIAGVYSTVFLLYMSDIMYLNKEMLKIKHELVDLKNQTVLINNLPSSNPTESLLSHRKGISGKVCLSYNEQRQILEYFNFICNLAILSFGSYSIYVHGIGTSHGLAYRLVFFLLKLCTIVVSIWLNLHFNKGLPSDIFLYIWIDVNCVASVYRSLRQIIENTSFQMMQALRQSLTAEAQRRLTFLRSSLFAQNVRYDASDSRSSSRQKKDEKQPNPTKTSNLNKTKTSEKKQKPNIVDDTKQPGTTRKDWGKPDQIVSNNPPYGKAGGSIDTHDPDRGKKA